MSENHSQHDLDIGQEHGCLPAAHPLTEQTQPTHCTQRPHQWANYHSRPYKPLLALSPPPPRILPGHAPPPAAPARLATEREQSLIAPGPAGVTAERLQGYRPRPAALNWHKENAGPAQTRRRRWGKRQTGVGTLMEFTVSVLHACRVRVEWYAMHVFVSAIEGCWVSIFHLCEQNKISLTSSRRRDV